MQPTYLPWAGYFDLMDQADVFVYLDTVQFARRSWQQRNRIMTARGELMLTVPVLSKGLRDQTIRDVRVDPEQRGFWDSHIRSIELAYSKATHGADVVDLLSESFRRGHERLADLTIDLIDRMAAVLELRPRTMRASDLSATGNKTQLLVAICQHVGATEYLSPTGSHAYLDGDDSFASAGVDLRYHRYVPAEYPQVHDGAFVPYLSVVDLMANVGFTRAREIIREGRQLTGGTAQ
jgi:hypothetical protein